MHAKVRCPPRRMRALSFVFFFLANVVTVWFVLTIPCCQGLVTTIGLSKAFFSPAFSRQLNTRISNGEIGADSDQSTPAEDEGTGVGIDLGTTYSCIAVLVDGIPTILPVPRNGRTMPSVVSIDPDNNILVGHDAIVNEVENPKGTYRNVKRVLGTGGRTTMEAARIVPNLAMQAISDEDEGGHKKRRRKKKKRLSLTKQIEDAEENPAKLLLPRQQGVDSQETVTPEAISSHVVKTLLETAEEQTGKNITRAVVGVPAYFHDAQRDATIRACQLAGVAKVKLLREPEAAALAYGIGKEQIGQGDDDELVLVFDLGGGTYDVSILNVGGGITEVIATGGNPRLGGSDFDARVAEHFCQVLKSHGVSQNFLSSGGEVADAIVRAAEQVRIFLSNNRLVELALPLTQEGWTTMPRASDVILEERQQFPDLELTSEGASNSTHVLCLLSRRDMEFLCKEDFQNLLRPVREVAIMAGALLPGDTRPAMVEAALEMEEEMDRAMQRAEGGSPFDFDDFYGDEKAELAASANVADPSELEGVDPGTLLQLKEFDMKEKKRLQQRGRKKARNVAKQERKYREEKRKIDGAASADVKVRDGINGRPISQVVLVGGATRMPAIGRLLAAITGVVPQRTVNPDEAVALGCAVQVGVLDGNQDLGGLMVLTPMQAAIMRAVAVKEGLHERDEGDFDDFGKDFGIDVD